MNKQSIMELAEQIARDLNEDIALASTRMEHVRVSSRANAAHTLVIALKEMLSDGTDAAGKSGTAADLGHETLF